MPLKGLTPGLSLASFPSPIPPKSGGSNIKSIQRGTVHTAAVWSSYPITIAAVDPSKSIVKLTFALDTNAAAMTNAMVGVELVNSTSILISRQGSGTSADTWLSWEVIEFNNVKSKQSGLCTNSVNQFTQAISAVDTSKSILFFTHTSNNPTTTMTTYAANLAGEITSPTLLTFNQYSGFGRNVYWQVIEFN